MAYRRNRGRGMGSAGLGDLVSSIASAIAQMEGYNTPGTLAQRNNNPGNLRSGAGQIGTSGGFAVFPDAQTGWAALDNQVQLNINRGLTLDQFFAGGNGYPGYAPSADSNDPLRYSAFVASSAGIPANVPLSSLSTPGTSPAGDSTGSLQSGLTDSSSLFDLSALDSSFSGGGTVSPWMIGGILLAGLGIVWLAS